MKSGLATGKQHLPRMPRADSRVEFFEQRIGHLPIRCILEQLVVSPDLAGSTPAVTDVVQIEDDDRQDVQVVIALLEMQSGGIQKDAQD